MQVNLNKEQRVFRQHLQFIFWRGTCICSQSTHFFRIDEESLIFFENSLVLARIVLIEYEFNKIFLH